MIGQPVAGGYGIISCGERRAVGVDNERSSGRTTAEQLIPSPHADGEGTFVLIQPSFRVQLIRQCAGRTCSVFLAGHEREGKWIAAALFDLSGGQLLVPGR